MTESDSRQRRRGPGVPFWIGSWVLVVYAIVATAMALAQLATQPRFLRARSRGGERTTEPDVGRLAEASRRFADAIVSNDADRIAACVGDEWRLVDADGVTNRDRFLDVVRSGALTHSMMRAVGEPEVRSCGDVGIVLARIVNTAHFDGQTFDADEWTTDVYAHRDGRWVCVHTHVTTVRGHAPAQ